MNSIGNISITQRSDRGDRLLPIKTAAFRIKAAGLCSMSGEHSNTRLMSGRTNAPK
jgi:hypothetical protein